MIKMFKYLERKPVYDIQPNSLTAPSQTVNTKPFKKSAAHYLLNALPLMLVLAFFSYFLFNYQPSARAPIFTLNQEAEAVNEAERAALEKELAEIEKQIAQYENLLQQTQKEKGTLINKINELKNKAAKLTLQIKAANLALSDLNIRIEDTAEAINKTINKIDMVKENLRQTLEALYETNQRPLLEILLGVDHISEYFAQTNALNGLQDKIRNQLAEIKELKNTLDTQKNTLEDKKDETEKILSIQVLQKQSLEETKKEQENILTVTKGKESQYQQVLSESKKRAAEIRNRIYELIGVKSQVTFGEALDIATWVASRTGVREALLLAVLTQESNLGKNVGTCNRPGDPESKSWRVVMRPDSREPFLQITKELGLNPDTTPISCPMQVGWGGAMGPAQFMPKTWLAYKDRIGQITGKNPPNPWDVRDAFVAAALYLANHGATAKTYDAEWKAAMMYFSGSTNPRFRFYGDNVMSIAKRYEADINTLRSTAKLPVQ